MRHVAPAVAVLALLAAACARDLALPPENRLAVEPAIGNVAPRERVVLTITGGSGSASIRFAEGSPHSGADATVDPVTLTYQSGSAGSAEDVIEVVDGAGGVATARITVGPRLAVSPPMGVVAPGGTVALVGSGGRPPYAFRMEAAPSGGAVGDDGVYVAGAVGDLVDVVVVSDATLDPAAEVRAQLRVTSALRIYPAQASLAPAETLAFVGLGGQPGYAFSVVSSTGGGVDASGVYTAGRGGGAQGAVDTVIVTDANGRTATASVAVGPTLSLSLLGAEVRPGSASQLVAAGGKAPYAYGFTARGNRSLGTVGLQTGDYVPGRNVGAQDELVVVDATGAQAILRPPAVGAMQVHVGIGAVRCLPGDFNADGRGDALLVAEDGNFEFLAARTFSLPAGSGAVERDVYLPPARVHDQALVADFNGTGRDQIVFFGQGGLWSLAPDAAGALGFGGSLPASAFFPGGPGLYLPAALIRGSTVHRIVTSAPCNGGAGLFRADWRVGASAPEATPACEPVTYAAQPFAMAAGDLNGDGIADLAWLERAGGANLSYGPVRVAYGLAGGGFGATSSFAFPVAGAYVDPWWFGNPEMTMVSTPTGLYLVLVPSAPGQNARIFLLRAGAGGAAPTWAAGFPVSFAWPVSGVAKRDAAGTQMAAWSTSGSLAFFDVTPSGPTAPVLSSAARPSMCAVFTDVDGDGVNDMVAGEAAATASSVLLGDGGVSYGARPRFAVTGAWSGLGDLDGDGAGDLIAASAGRALRVLFGGGGQFSYGPEVTLDHAVVGIGSGPLGGTRPRAIVVDETEAVKLLDVSADGGTMTPSALGTVSLYFSRPIRVLAHDFAGTAAGADVMVVTENGSRESGARYTATYFVRNAAGIQVATSDLLWQDQWCDVLPAGTGSAVALCVRTDRSTVRAWRTTVGGFAAAWTALASFAGAGGNASLAGAGVLPTGEAVFVLSPAAAAPAPVRVLTVSAGGAISGPTILAGTVGPVTGALLGDLDGIGGLDLVVSAGGEVRTFLAGATPGTWVAADVLAAPGGPGAFVSSGAGGIQDVVFGTGTAVLPLLGSGDGSLQ